MNTNDTSSKTPSSISSVRSSMVRRARKEAFVLNPGDPGLLRQLDAIGADAAAARPMPGKTTSAAHVDHLCFGLSLLNRWSEGRER